MIDFFFCPQWVHSNKLSKDTLTSRTGKWKYEHLLYLFTFFFFFLLIGILKFPLRVLFCLFVHYYPSYYSATACLNTIFCYSTHLCSSCPVESCSVRNVRVLPSLFCWLAKLSIFNSYMGFDTWKKRKKNKFSLFCLCGYLELRPDGAFRFESQTHLGTPIKTYTQTDFRNDCKVLWTWPLWIGLSLLFYYRMKNRMKIRANLGYFVRF